MNLHYKKDLLTEKDLRRSLFFNKDTPTQVFYCQFCKLLKNSLFDKTPPVAAFIWSKATILSTIKMKMF